MMMMASWIALLLLLLLLSKSEGMTITSSVGNRMLTGLQHVASGVQPCSFNELCDCKSNLRLIGSNAKATKRTSAPTDHQGGIICVNVPFSSVPRFPAGPVSHIDLVNAGLEYLPEGSLFLPGVKSLRLTGNKIKMIDNATFSLIGESLRSLDLSYNSLAEFPSHSFLPLKKLEWLNLDSNKIASLDEWPGQQLPSTSSPSMLGTLFLAGNEITQINPSTSFFSGMGSLTWLNLDSNGLGDESMSTDLFPKSLSILFLANNILQEFPINVMTELPNLMWLYLRGNHVRYLPSSMPWATNGAVKRHWDKLDVSENFLPELPANGSLFGGSVTVNDFYADHNWFSEVPSRAFLGMQVKRLSLAHNRIEKLAWDSLLGIHDSLVSLDLEDNKLGHVPAELARLTNLTLLYLSRNGIQSLLPTTSTMDGSILGFRLHMCQQHLEVLDLNHNLLQEVPSEELRQCTRLTSLGLANNNISGFTGDDFALYGQQLDSLTLRSNRISRVIGRSFQHTPLLRELSLSFNPITFVAPDAFSDLSNSLEKLSLSGCLDKLKDYPQDQLSYLRSLQTLIMDNNALQSLPEAALLFFTNIRLLNLEYNRLRNIPRSIFHSNVHSRLMDLRLGHNHLLVLEHELFHHLEMLQTVVLSYNQIQRIHMRAFSQLPNLAAVLLDNNRIQFLEKDAFHHLPLLARLDLQFNLLQEFPLDCLANAILPPHSSNNRSRNLPSSMQNFEIALNLTHNKIHSIVTTSSEFVSQSFGGREPSVTLQNFVLFLKSIDLSHNLLEEVPSNLLQAAAAGKVLRYLCLKNNRIFQLGPQPHFQDLEKLVSLDLSHNVIRTVHPAALNIAGSHLQILDLSHNAISALPASLFQSALQLRVLDLSGNHITQLPVTLFRTTLLEQLNLAGNNFRTVPSVALSNVQHTLTSLDLRKNQIQYVDQTSFANTTNLLSLLLGANNIRSLPEGVFSELGNKLLTLDLSHNSIHSASVSRAIQPLTRLRSLNLAYARITEFPSVVPTITNLNLSHNDLTARSLQLLLYKQSVNGSASVLAQTPDLRVLDISYNQIEDLPAGLFVPVPRLSVLDLSGNPLSTLTKEKFHGLGQALKKLALVQLEQVIRFDSDTLSRLLRLDELWIQTFPWIDKYRFRLGAVLGYLTNLRVLHVHIRQLDLSDQLHGAACPKLKELDIWGLDLKRVDPNAFRDIFGSSSLVLRIHNTSLEKIPEKLIDKIDHIPLLTLDLSNNMLKEFFPSSIYNNVSDWESVGTTVVSGGLHLEGNPLICSCNLTWVGKWLRRWLQESQDIQGEMLDRASELQAAVQHATCTEPKTGRIIALVELHETNSNDSSLNSVFCKQKLVSPGKLVIAAGDIGDTNNGGSAVFVQIVLLVISVSLWLSNGGISIFWE
ncbi:unnamed protein product [Notodromas monacha]|uniref:Chaoptin n=1 Tax=Notodromas monacha TaxID=399045 RepID=A0A7R9GDI7_9CRUS|nr:unnamed protein product [Notodromas monacha]CAG0916955.1 unnamed protein product [Notodromas monacha]